MGQDKNNTSALEMYPSFSYKQESSCYLPVHFNKQSDNDKKKKWGKK
jgi:hypothetical protein